jgi:predicted DCC family thiol-disulfide oxidoreductase YuxK
MLGAWLARMTIDEFRRLLPAPDADMVVIYDGQCVFCSAYVRLIRLREAVGRVALIDGRNDGVAELMARELGLDLNEGMLVLHHGRSYYGSEAMNILSLLTTRSGLLNRAIASVFRSPTLARMLYPVMRLGRRVTLALLGRSPIRLDGAAAAAVSTAAASRRP